MPDSLHYRGAAVGVGAAMTIVVSVRVTDGIVLAADSATTFFNSANEIVKVYDCANKVYNLLKGCPIGAMTYGSGSIGTASISTLSKDLRVELGRQEGLYHLDREKYTVQEVAELSKRFFDEAYRLAYPDGRPGFRMGYRVCGYSRPGTLPEAWEIVFTENSSTDPIQLYADGDYGPLWQGEVEAIDRLIFGVGPQFVAAMQQIGVSEENAIIAYDEMKKALSVQLYVPAMPIQDAIDLAKFLAGTSARFAHFAYSHSTVGGHIELATITKHEGFKWVSRKHYYSADYNRESTDHVC